MKDIISIIIPMYNSAKTIENTINSVINQTYKNWELIIVDDCSTDNSIKEVEKFLKKDNRIKLLRSYNNFGGPARPRNIGIKHAISNYIAFLDSDDIWSKNKLEVCSEHLNKNVDIIFHDVIRFGNLNFTQSKIIKGRKLSKPIIVDLLVNGNGIVNSSVIVRKDIIKKVGYLCESKKMIASEDFNLWLKIADISDNFYYIPQVLGSYMVGEQNISSKDMFVSYKKAALKFEKYLTRKQKNKYLSRIYYVRGRYFFLNSKYLLSCKYLCYVIKNGTISMQLKSVYMMIFSIFIYGPKNYFLKTSY